MAHRLGLCAVPSRTGCSLIRRRELCEVFTSIVAESSSESAHLSPRINRTLSLRKRPDEGQLPCARIFSRFNFNCSFFFFELNGFFRVVLIRSIFKNKTRQTKKKREFFRVRAFFHLVLILLFSSSSFKKKKKTFVIHKDAKKREKEFFPVVEEEIEAPQKKLLDICSLAKQVCQ